MPPLTAPTAALFRALAAVAAVLGLGWTLLAAPPAVAAAPAPIEISGTDPAGDARYQGTAVEAGADIVGFNVVQDRPAKVIRGSVTFAGATFSPKTHKLRIALGNLSSYGDGCDVWEALGVTHLRYDLGDPAGDWQVNSLTVVGGRLTASHSGTVVNFETPAGPWDGYGYRCAIITSERIISSDTTGWNSDFKAPQDKAVAVASEEVIAQPNAPVDPGKGVPAPILDADGDGVHDGVDKCPQVPGAALSGCENVPLAKSVKLGTKRVVIDRLLGLNAATCPKTVKIVAKLKGKTVGKLAAGTMKKGKFCHVQTVMKLKKRVKKARVTIAGAGVSSVAVTVAK